MGSQVLANVYMLSGETEEREENRLGPKAVLPSAIRNTGRRKAWGWGDQEPEETEEEASEIKV